jgi:hypothetical protein
MKAERRHQLQANTLAAGLGGFPEWLRQNAWRIVIVLAVAVLAYSAVQFRNNARIRRELDAAQSLTMLRQRVRAISGRFYNPQQGMSEQELAAQRNGLADSAQSMFDQVIADTDESQPALRAQAYLLHAELNWTLANLPNLPASTTQPALRVPQSPGELLVAAAHDYQQVIDDYPEQTLARASALFGLAAIAEDHGAFGPAAQQYQQIMKDDTLPQSLRDAAKSRLAQIATMRKPVFFGFYPPTTQPTTLAARATTQPMAEQTGQAEGQPPSDTGAILPGLEPSESNPGAIPQEPPAQSGAQGPPSGAEPTTEPSFLPEKPLLGPAVPIPSGPGNEPATTGP